MHENDSINPYATPSAATPIDPILFQGSVDSKHVLDAGKPLQTLTTRQRWFWRLVNLSVVTYGLFHVVQCWVLWEPIHPLVWTVVVFSFTVGFWLPAVRHGLTHWGNNGARLKRMRERADQGLSDRRGWIDADGLTIWADGLAAKLRWDCFDKAEIWPDMIRLPDRFDYRLRTVLPLDHFESAESFLAAQMYLNERGAQSVHDAPLHDLVHERFGDIIHAFDFSTQDAASWAADQWPPDGETVEHNDFVVRLSGDKSWSRLMAVFLMQGVLGSMLWFLPVGLATIVWLLVGLRASGDGNFLVDGFRFQLLYVGPLVGIVLLLVFHFYKLFSDLLALTSPPMQMTLTPRGIYSNLGGSELWWNWSAMHVADEKNGKVFLLATSGLNPILLNEKMFESPTRFQTFVALLETYHRGVRG